MVKAKDFRLGSIQFSVFTPFVNFQKSSILNTLISNFNYIFNGEVITLPVPESPKQDYLQLMMTSEDKKMRLEIAPLRINMFRSLGEEEPSIEDSSFFKISLDVFKKYLEHTSARVGRLAIVVIRHLEIEKPGFVLANHFCKKELMEEPFDRPEGFEIHAHKKYTISDFMVNSWVRCKAGSLVKNKKSIILVEQDINTLSEETEKNDFNIEQIQNFCKLIYEEQYLILCKYFRNNG